MTFNREALLREMEKELKLVHRAASQAVQDWAANPTPELRARAEAATDDQRRMVRVVEALR